MRNEEKDRFPTISEQTSRSEAANGESKSEFFPKHLRSRQRPIEEKARFGKGNDGDGIIGLNRFPPLQPGGRHKNGKKREE